MTGPDRGEPPCPASIFPPQSSRPTAATVAQCVKAKLGSVPNLFRLLAVSPAALEGYLGLSGALGKGSLDARTRERIALAVAEFNGCGYCTSAHAFIGKNMAGLSMPRLPPTATAVPPTIARRRRSGSRSRWSRRAARSPTPTSLRSGSGYWMPKWWRSLHVALNTLTNYVNEVAETAIDFPAVKARDGMTVERHLSAIAFTPTVKAIQQQGLARAYERMEAGRAGRRRSLPT
jgi:hypothetical protein